MKHVLVILAICCGTMLLLTSSSVWEGSAAMSRYGEFPSSGYYGASNSFPRNTVVAVTNPRSGRSVDVLVVKRVDDSGVFMLLSPQAASAIGMSQNDVSRVQVSLASAGGGLVQAYPDELPYHPDPDVNPQAQRGPFAAAGDESVVELLPPSQAPTAAEPPPLEEDTEPPEEAVTQAPETDADQQPPVRQPTPAEEPAPEDAPTEQPEVAEPGPPAREEPVEAAETPPRVAQAETAPERPAGPREAEPEFQRELPPSPPEDKDLEPRKAEPPKPSTEKMPGEIRVAMKPQPRASEEEISSQVPMQDPIDAFADQAAARTPQKRLHYPPREDPQFALVDIPDASRISRPMRLGRLPEARVEPEERPTVDTWEAPSPEEPETPEQPVLPPEPPNLVVEQVEGPEVSERMAEAPRPEADVAAAAPAPEPPADAAEAETIPSNGIPRPGETELALEPAELRPPVAPGPDATSLTYAGPEEPAAREVPVDEPAAPSREPSRVAEAPEVTPSERPEAAEPADATQAEEAPSPPQPEAVPEEEGAPTPPSEKTDGQDLSEIIAELERAIVPEEEQPSEAVAPSPAERPTPAAVSMAGAATIDELRPGAYYLQIGVFSSERNVTDAAKAFEGTYPVAVLPQVGAERRLYKVFVGPLREDEGGAMLYLARSKGYRDAFLRIGR
jgi:rare lipoprotein A (peptidoglycan hydrolase)